MLGRRGFGLGGSGRRVPASGEGRKRDLDTRRWGSKKAPRATRSAARAGARPPPGFPDGPSARLEEPPTAEAQAKAGATAAAGDQEAPPAEAG